MNHWIIRIKPRGSFRTRHRLLGRARMSIIASIFFFVFSNWVSYLEKKTTCSKAQTKNEWLMSSVMSIGRKIKSPDRAPKSGKHSEWESDREKRTWINRTWITLVFYSFVFFLFDLRKATITHQILRTVKRIINYFCARLPTS